MNPLTYFTQIPEKTRALLYRVSTAVVLLAGLYGIVDKQQSAGWLALAAALFSGTMATANTSTALPPPAPGTAGDYRTSDQYGDRGSSAIELLVTVLVIVVILVVLLRAF